MKGLKIYFSDFFGVDEDIIESYGAVNISMINDMPLFVDPFCCLTAIKKSIREFITISSSTFYFCKNKQNAIRHLRRECSLCGILFLKSSKHGLALASKEMPAED